MSTTTDYATPATVKPGQMLTELLHTDTRGWEVLRTTAKTVTVRPARWGEMVEAEHPGGTPWPVEYYRLEPDPAGRVRTLRLRKDGTLRAIDGGRPLRPAATRDGVPVVRVDRRY